MINLFPTKTQSSPGGILCVLSVFVGHTLTQLT